MLHKLSNTPLNKPSEFKQAAKAIRELSTNYPELGTAERVKLPSTSGYPEVEGIKVFKDNEAAVFQFGGTKFKCQPNRVAVCKLSERILKGIPSEIKANPIKKYKTSYARGSFLPQYQNSENIAEYCELWGREVPENHRDISLYS